MMGFCLYDVAVAAAAALHHPTNPCKRILVVDWDVHHGTGPRCSRATPRVVLSIHRHDRGNFCPPGDGGAPFKVGVGTGAGFNVNVGWDGGGTVMATTPMRLMLLYLCFACIGRSLLLTLVLMAPGHPSVGAT